MYEAFFSFNAVNVPKASCLFRATFATAISAAQAVSSASISITCAWDSNYWQTPASRKPRTSWSHSILSRAFKKLHLLAISWIFMMKSLIISFGSWSLVKNLSDSVISFPFGAKCFTSSFTASLCVSSWTLDGAQKPARRWAVLVLFSTGAEGRGWLLANGNQKTKSLFLLPKAPYMHGPFSGL